MKKTRLIPQLLETKVPKILYHYTSGSGLVGIIESNKIWTTKIHYLNDKSESVLAFKLLEDEINLALSGKNAEIVRTNSELEKMYEHIDHLRIPNVSVASFTEAGDQLSQWRGYCDVGNGYSIGFKGPSLQDALRVNNNYRLVPCVYDENLQRKMIRELINLSDLDNVKKLRDIENPTFDEMNFYEAALFLSSFIKSVGFIEEKEWRLVSFPLSYVDAKYRQGNYSLRPYWEFEFEKNSIEEIYIGPTSEPFLSKMAVNGLLIKNFISISLFDLRQSSIPFGEI